MPEVFNSKWNKSRPPKSRVRTALILQPITLAIPEQL